MELADRLHGAIDEIQRLVQTIKELEAANGNAGI
jgi:hypothetical protein